METDRGRTCHSAQNERRGRDQGKKKAEREEDQLLNVSLEQSRGSGEERKQLCSYSEDVRCKAKAQAFL